MNPSETSVQKAVDIYLTKFRTSEILYYPFVAGIPDEFMQQTKTFGPPISLIGRAVLRPTPEKLTVIGNDEQYDVAFLFSRLEMLRKFPLAEEGEWILSSGQFNWWNRRFKIEKVRPTAQTGQTFSLVAAMANSLQGARDL